MNIPPINLKAQFKGVRKDILKAYGRYWTSRN
jgi:hypothetical protein